MPRLRPTLAVKLFAAVLATALVVVVAMVAAANVSFTRGFVGYLNEQGIARMREVLPRAEAAYRRHGSWQFLHDQPQAWFPLVLPRPHPQDDDDHPHGDWHPGDHPPPGDHPWSHGDGGPHGDHPGFAGGPPHAASAPPFEPPISDLTGAGLRLGLLDADGKLVAGYPNAGPDALREPIVVDGRRVGWLAIAAFQSVSVAGGERFRLQQLGFSVATGLAALALSAIIAWRFGRIILEPLRRVSEATHQLAAGAYGTRVDDVRSDDEVGRLAADFNRLAQALARTEQMRRDFIADISHELRTPLGVLHGELEAVEDGVRPLSAATVASLQAEVATLNKLVSDLYDLSLADVGALTYRKVEVDLVELLQATVDRQRDRFAARALRLEFVPPAGAPRAVVFGDERRLQQLFDNLCENALRYTDAGGVLRIAVRLADGPGGARVAVDFSDSAPGVPPDALPRLFERFFRVDPSRNRAHGGAGLGLAICRNIATAHDGTLLADASPLGGLRVVATLPLAP